MASIHSYRSRPKRSFKSFGLRKRSKGTGSSPATPSTPNQLFKEPRPVSIFQSGSEDLDWYENWLHGQVANLPSSIRELRVGETLLDNSGFEVLFSAVANFLQNNAGTSIDEVIEHLRQMKMLDSIKESFKAQRTLIFAILGWQSMLYLPAFNTCSGEEFSVLEDNDSPNSGLVFDKYKVSSSLADRPLFIVLKGFGNILPSPAEDYHIASENSKAAANWLSLNPTETNIHLLITLLHIRIRWVDCLALHLDYDKSSRTLSLFSCPSFCVAMLQSKGPIFSFASTETNSFNPRASEHDITQLMREVLLSFRLLFGQHGPSRKQFPRIFKPPTRLQKVDNLLPILCMVKKLHDTPISLSTCKDQPVYFTGQHFPVLSERIKLIAKELRDSRPSSMKGLLLDRRDKLQYWTFWLVSIFGTLSILLSAIQVILQAIQLVWPK